MKTVRSKSKRKSVEPTAFDSFANNPTALKELGNAIGLAMADASSSARGAMNGSIAFKDVTGMTPANFSVYGRNSIFDPCVAGDIFGLQVQTNGLMNWLGWRPNKYYRRRVDFIPWWGPAGTQAGTPDSGAGAPCDDPTGWEYGNCGYELLHKSWYHRSGEALDPHTIVQERCETSPRYRLNGQIIQDDVEWQMNGVMMALSQGLKHDQIYGSHTNPYEMEGLEGLIKTGYTDTDLQPCPAVDSAIVAWGNDDLDGEVNGLGNFFNYLDELVTEIEYRAQNMGTIAERDMILLMPRFLATAVLDAFACYTTCGVTSANDITDQSMRSDQRAARRDLNGGPLYDGSQAVGYIHLKSGRRLPIMVEDAMLIGSSGSKYCSDIYLLTRRIGSMDVLYGEYLDLRQYQNRAKKADPNFKLKVDAAGRFAMRGKQDNWCVQFMAGTSPEIYLSAPWAQARITDVCVTRSRKPVVSDPWQPVNYLPGSPDYLYRADSYE